MLKELEHLKKQQVFDGVTYKARKTRTDAFYY